MKKQELQRLMGAYPSQAAFHEAPDGLVFLDKNHASSYCTEKGLDAEGIKTITPGDLNSLETEPKEAAKPKEAKLVIKAGNHVVTAAELTAYPQLVEAGVVEGQNITWPKQLEPLGTE